MAATGCPTTGQVFAHPRQLPSLRSLALSTPPTWHHNHRLFYLSQFTPRSPWLQLTSLSITLPPAKLPTNFPLEATRQLRHLQLLNAVLDADLALDVSRLRRLNTLSLPFLRLGTGFELALWVGLQDLKLVSLYGSHVSPAVLHLVCTAGVVTEVDLR